MEYEHEEEREDVDYDPELVSQEHQVCCTGCMNCLGLTWADFL